MPETLIEGLNIAFEHRRPAAAPSVRVLYVHGTGCHAGVFERHMEVVSRHYEVAAIDLPGHGRSGGNGFRGVADYAFFVGQLVQALGWQRCVVAGHSLGGGIALASALYFPDNVQALMLIDTGARLRVAPEILAAARRAAAGEVAPAGNPTHGFAATTPESVYGPINALMGACRPEVTARDWIADDTCDFMSRLGGIAVPTLAVCGAEDVFTPVKYHEYLRDHLPACTLSVIERAGHWSFAEQPEAFDEVVLGFLGKL